MDIIKICAFCLTALMLILVVKEQNKSIAVFLSIISGVTIMIYVLVNIEGIFTMLNNLSSKSGMDTKYLSLILKIAGIAYLIEFGKNVCTDSGESALATKLELAGKVMIVTLTLPIFSEILEVIIGLI